LILIMPVKIAIKSINKQLTYLIFNNIPFL